MNKLKVFIIILHYGDIGFTLNCLKSLQKINKNKISASRAIAAPHKNLIRTRLNKQSGKSSFLCDKNFRKSLKFLGGGLNVKTIVIANTQIFQSEKKEIKKLSDIFIQNKKNLGFAAGNNIGIKYALKNGADYVLLLNNDTIVYKNFLLYLIKVAEEYLDVGIVGPTLKHKIKNITLYDYGGVINWKLGKTYHINKTKDRDRELRERDFVSGCCTLVKKQVFEKIGLLNESYFLYLEDVEFCVRAKKAGFTILLNPNSCIFHFGSQSTTEFKKIIYSLRNSLKFTWRFAPLKYKPIAIIYNILFYPAIFLKWRLKAIKQSVLEQ